MRMRNTIKVPANYNSQPAFVYKRVAKGIYPENLVKGLLASNFNIQLGEAGEDFVRKQLTVVITYSITKIPRFANPLHKIKKPNICLK